MNFFETDLLWMSLCVFMPSVFALALVFFPKGSEEAMRWTSLVGTAVTFVISMFVFIDYYQMLDRHPDKGVAAAAGIKRPDVERTSLIGRAQIAAERDEKNQEFLDKDQLARYPWIPRFAIDYYLGIDGISMALILLTTVLFFLS